MTGINAFFWVLAAVVAGVALCLLFEFVREQRKERAERIDAQTLRWLDKRAVKTNGGWHLEVPADTRYYAPRTFTDDARCGMWDEERATTKETR